LPIFHFLGISSFFYFKNKSLLKVVYEEDPFAVSIIYILRIEHSNYRTFVHEEQEEESLSGCALTFIRLLLSPQQLLLFSLQKNRFAFHTKVKILLQSFVNEKKGWKLLFFTPQIETRLQATFHFRLSFTPTVKCNNRQRNTI